MSLPHGHPLASYHPEKGFVYLRDTLDRIKHIKGYGYTAEEYLAVVTSLVEEYESINDAISGWPERLSIKKLDEVEDIVKKLRALNGTTSLYLAKTLALTIEAAALLGKTEPVGDWKAKYAVKGDD